MLLIRRSGDSGIIAEERHICILHIAHLVVAEEDCLEGVDVGDLAEAGAIVLCKVSDKRFEVFTFDVFEEFEAGRIEEVIAWHGFIDDIEDWAEVSFGDQFLVIVFVLETDALAEELKGSELQVLLWRGKQLCYPRSKPFGKDVEFASHLMGAGKVDNDLDKVVEELNFIECYVAHWKAKQSAPIQL